MMRHQTILHRKWWRAHARCCLHPTKTHRREQKERESCYYYNNYYYYRICIEIGEIFFLLSFPFWKGRERHQRQQTGLNHHVLCITVKKCKENNKKNSRHLRQKCNLAIYFLPAIHHTRYLYNLVFPHTQSLPFSTRCKKKKTRSLGKEAFSGSMFAQIVDRPSKPTVTRNVPCVRSPPHTTRLQRFAFFGAL